MQQFKETTWHKIKRNFIENQAEINKERRKKGLPIISNKAAILEIFKIIGFIGIIVALLLFPLITGMFNSGDKSATNKSNEKSINISSFESVGFFKSDKMRGFTHFVTNPTEHDIRAFCEKEKSSYINNRLLYITFFDDRSHTPDVTLNYYFPQSSDPYLVASYFYNPFNQEQGLTFYKEIPK
jgi:hypothetical protein